MPEKKVFFLKTSKTGSTTIANIMTRFAFKHNLSALLGEQPNSALFFRTDYLPFSSDDCYLGRDVQPSPKFDISFVHLRYNREAIEKVLKPDMKKVTILR